MRDAGELKTKASEAFAKGKFAKAGELYASYCEQSPKDLQSRLRMGDAFAKAGERDKAISAYSDVAEQFAKDGFFPRAIAASKLILELDPLHKGVQQMLAGLYSQRVVAPPKSAQPVPTRTLFAPPGMNPRERAPEVSGAAKRTPEESRFTELEISGDSLLQALEQAAGLMGRVEELPPSVAPQPDGSEKIPLFSDLPRDAFIALLEQCPLRRLGLGERVIEQGARGDAFYVICEGSVRVVREEHGASKQIAILTHGAFFGEMALLSGAPRAASVESMEEGTQLLEISASVLNPLARQFPAVAQALRRFCRQRLLTNVMDTSTLFRPFPKQGRRALVEKFLAREVRNGERIIREGDRGEGLFVILSGEVEVTQGAKHVATLREGELFGEMSLLTGSNASASVSATRRTSLLRLPAEAFEALLQSHPQLRVMIAKLTEERGQQLLEWSRPLVTETAEDELVLIV